jgi:hypothetical protein
MKTLFKLFLLATLLLGAARYLHAQEINPRYKVELKDGTRLTGTIISQNDSIIIMNLNNIGELKLQRSEVTKIIPLDASKEVKRSYWFPNPNATRLFFAPTAIPLRKGEGYYQNIYLVGNMFNVGVANNLSVGAGFDFISMFATMADEWRPVLNFNAKTGFKVHEQIHVGAGGIVVTMPGEFNAGILYGLGTFGSFDNNFTFGTGWGFVDGEFERKPFIMMGVMARFSEKIWFVSENWFAPVDDPNYYFVISYGLRFSGRKISVDLGFINNKDIVQAILIGIPYIDFVVKFGK